MDFSNIKLVKVLQTFNTTELNRLEKFVRSPYFNVSESILGLFDIIYTAIREEKPSLLDKERVFEQLYPDKKYADSRFRKLCSDLLKLTEEFLAIEQFKENPLHEASYLMQAISNRRIAPLYNSVLKSARRLSDQQQEIAPSYYYYQYEIEKNYVNMMEAEFKREHRLNLEQIARNLDYFFIAEKLRYLNTGLSQKRFVKQDYEFLFIDEILGHLEDHNYENIPQISINHTIYKVYETPEEDEHYFTLKSLIFKHLHHFPKMQARGIFLDATNFCVRRLNQGHQNFLKELFFLYKYAIENDILLVNNEFSPWTFKNIVIVGLRLKEFEWTEKFIHNYSQYLNEKQRENAVTFNLARLYLYMGDYNKVLELLRAVEFDDISYNLGAKAMLLVTYYELDEIDALLSFLGSFRVFLNRKKNKLPEQRRKNYINLIKYTQKLARLNPMNQESVRALKKEISEAGNIADIKWLTEKVEELEK